MKKNTIALAVAATLSTILMTGCGGGSSLEDDLNKANEGAYDYLTIAPYPAPPISEAQKAEFLNAINAARAQQRTCGEYGVMQPAPPLQWNDILYRAAYEHTVDMHDTGVMQHTGSGTESDWTAIQSNLNRGSTVPERVIANGAKHGTSENIAKGYSSTASVMQAWLNSPIHCNNIMDSSKISIGMARVGNYWTQEFGGY